MAEYKLYYFNLRARGELARLVFAAAGQKYEDIRISREQWPEYKAKAPFGQGPFLEVIEGSETFKMAQSISIARYLARKFGLAGKNENESALIDMYGDQITDLCNDLVKAHFESNADKKKELEEKFANETLPNNFKLFEDRLAKSGSGFIASSGLSWADLYLFVLTEWLGPKRDAVLDKFKLIKANTEKVAAVPGVANWLKVRPVTDM